MKLWVNHPTIVFRREILDFVLETFFLLSPRGSENLPGMCQRHSSTSKRFTQVFEICGRKNERTKESRRSSGDNEKKNTTQTSKDHRDD